MKATKLVLDDKAVYLRLSAVKLAEYAKSIQSSGNTVFAIMDSLDDLEKQAALFNAALTYNGNLNDIHDGFELIDMLADAQYDPIAVKTLILQLAEEAGVISSADAARMSAAIKAGNERLYNIAVAVLTGDTSSLSDEEGKSEQTEENPT